MARSARRWREVLSGVGDDTCEFRESRRGARLAFHARGGLADSRRRETARLWRQASRGSAAAIARQRRAVDCFQPLTGLLLCWNLRAALSGALRRLGYYTRRVNSPLLPACRVGRADTGERGRVRGPGMASVARTRPLNLLIDYHERGHPGSPTPSFAACSEARPRQGRRRACAPPVVVEGVARGMVYCLCRRAGGQDAARGARRRPGHTCLKAETLPAVDGAAGTASTVFYSCADGLRRRVWEECDGAAAKTPRAAAFDGDRGDTRARAVSDEARRLSPPSVNSAAPLRRRERTVGFARTRGRGPASTDLGRRRAKSPPGGVNFTSPRGPAKP